MIRQVMFATVGVIAFAAAANAADIYRAPEGVSYKDAPVYSPSWAGFYAGVNGGYGWSDNSISCASGLLYCDRNSLSGTKNFSSEGGFGGGQIGYNWQPFSGGGYKDGPARSNFFFGIEADLQGADIDGTATLSSLGGGSSARDSLDWFGTVRARAGFVFGSTLLYGTGGFAFGEVKDRLTVSAVTVSNDKTATGYVVGGGMEYAFSPRWSGKVEYQFINLGGDTLVNNGVTADFSHEYSTIRVGLNYHFGSDYVPLK